MDILISLNVRLKVCHNHFCSLSVHSNKIIFNIFFFCTLILNATINLEHAALHTKDYCKTGTIPPHDITSGKGLQSHCCQSCRESQTTPSQGALPPLELERQTRRDSTNLHTFFLFWCLDITVVQIDPLVPRVLGLKSPCSHLKDSMEATGWTNGGTINTNQCLVRIPLSEHTGIH